MARNTDRAGLDPAVRVLLLEQDADRAEAAMAEERALVRQQLDEFREAAAANTKVLIGILVAVTTAAILLAINLAVK